MKPTYFWLIFIILITLALISAVQSENLYPTLQLSAEKWDFGVIREGDIVERDFIIKNKGRGSLFILEIIASCDCTTVTVADEEVSAGEKTSFKVTFDSKGLNGIVQRMIVIRSNDPDQPIKRLIITGKVKPKK